MIRVLGVCRYKTAYGPSFSFLGEFCIADGGVHPYFEVARKESGR
jgi:hypothetical protein